MDQEMGNKTKFETRNGREMGKETEFKKRNVHKREMRRDKIYHFSTKNKKNRENTGKQWKKTLKNRRKKQGEKTEIYKKYRNKILMRFWEMLKTETSFQ